MVRTKKKKHVPWVKEVVIIGASVLTIISACAVIFGWAVNHSENEPEFQLFLCDENGFPRTDVVIESPDGPRYADDHGKITARSSWCGQEITIHDAKTWQLIETIIISNRESKRIVKIILNGECVVEE